MKELISRLKKICKTNSNIADIILFGSAMRQKRSPKDLDIIILVKEEIMPDIEKTVEQIRDTGKELKLELHIDHLLLDNLFREKIILNLLHEGYSIKDDRPIRENLQTENAMLVTYSLENLNQQQKNMFGHALRGRYGRKGILEEAGGKKVGSSGVLIPVENFEQFREFLDNWDVKYTIRRVLLV